MEKVYAIESSFNKEFLKEIPGIYIPIFKHRSIGDIDGIFILLIDYAVRETSINLITSYSIVIPVLGGEKETVSVSRNNLNFNKVNITVNHKLEKRFEKTESVDFCSLCINFRNKLLFQCESFGGRGCTYEVRRFIV